MGFENVGTSWSKTSFKRYLDTLQPPLWCDAITLHHTGFPDLGMRPAGLTASHIDNIQGGYVRDLGWDSGPHLFVDDDQCWGMCDLLTPGIHAHSFNARAIAIEVLGNYNVDDPGSGRGLKCWNTATAISRLLLDWLGLEANALTVLFHREEPQAIIGHKLCPGTNVEKTWVLDKIQSAVIPRVPGPGGAPGEQYLTW